MQWAPFHHPDLSLTVLRRHASEEFLDFLLEFGEASATWGKSVLAGHTYPNQSAYRSARYRLRKKGLIAYQRQGGKNPVLMLTPEGKAQRPDVLRPEKHWNRKWNRIWYVLVYDVPEKERPYRASLRGFLRQMRMGCLQGSVWVTPDDIRPEFADLKDAGGVSNFAFLFEARTVLGQPPREVVDAAWDFRRLLQLQEYYCKASEINLHRIRNTQCDSNALLNLARDELAAYLRAMGDDPLLPRVLWPPDYRGGDVFRLHRNITNEIRERL